MSAAKLVMMRAAVQSLDPKEVRELLPELLILATEKVGPDAVGEVVNRWAEYWGGGLKYFDL